MIRLRTRTERLDQAPRSSAPRVHIARAAHLTALTIALLSAACQAPEPPVGSGAGGRKFVWATISDPKTFNPILITDNGSFEILANVFDGLVRLNLKTLEFEPALAERWEHDEAGTSWTFHLRRGVRWHDGVPFTAADVVFTFEAIFDPAVPNSSKHVLMIDGQPIRAEALDDLTVRLTLPRPFAPLLSSLPDIVPKHRLGESLANGSFVQQWGINTPPDQIVGTGPYRLVQYLQSQYVRFERNPSYWLQDASGASLPYLETRTALIVPDMDTAFLKFRAGETSFHLPRPEEIADLKAAADGRQIEVNEIGLSTASQFVVFNRNRERARSNPEFARKLKWFTDLNFVRALAHAIDKQAMVVNCLAGYGRPAVSEMSPSNAIYYNPNLADYDYDLAAAADALRAGGYQLKDGVLHDPEGAAVELSLTTNAGNKIRERMCAIIQEDWGKLGIKVNFRPVEFTSLVEKLDTTFDWDTILIGFTSSPDPHNGANLLRSSGNLHMWYPNQKTPATEWEAEIDRLVEAGSRELDTDKRRAQYWRIQEILHRELPMIQTVRAIEYEAHERYLQNIERTVWGMNRQESIRFAP